MKTGLIVHDVAVAIAVAVAVADALVIAIVIVISISAVAPVRGYNAVTAATSLCRWSRSGKIQRKTGGGGFPAMFAG
jgi:hypothetical protein